MATTGKKRQQQKPHWAKGLAAAHASLKDPSVRRERCSTAAATGAAMAMVASRRAEYEQNPRRCLHCNSALSYAQSARDDARYCSKSCATHEKNRLRLVTDNGVFQKTRESVRRSLSNACIEAEFMSSALMAHHPMVDDVSNCRISLRGKATSKDDDAFLRNALFNALREVDQTENDKWFAYGGVAFRLNRLSHAPAGDLVVATSIDGGLFTEIPLSHVLDTCRTHRLTRRQVACTLAKRQQIWDARSDSANRYPSPLHPSLQNLVAGDIGAILAAAPAPHKIWLQIFESMPLPAAAGAIRGSYFQVQRGSDLMRAAAWVCLYHMIAERGALSAEIFAPTIYYASFPAELRAQWIEAQKSLSALDKIIAPKMGATEFRSQYGIVAGLPNLR